MKYLVHKFARKVEFKSTPGLAGTIHLTITFAGLLGEAGGGLLSLTGVGTIPGLAVIGGSTATVVYGGGVTVGAFAGLMSSGKALLNMSGRSQGSGGLSSSGKKSVKSLQKRINEHKQKLKEYLENPDAHDNKGLLKDASPERRQSIIEGRRRHLQGEIDTFEKNARNSGEN